jgi:hypothetical protein
VAKFRSSAVHQFVQAPAPPVVLKPGVAAQHRVAGQFPLPPEQAGMVGADLEGAIGIWGYWASSRRSE